MLNLPANKIKTHISVVLVGVGGTGSIVLSMLAQMHHLLSSLDSDCGLRVVAYDPDTVSPFNIGRQNFWAHDLHEPKSQVLIERLNVGFGMNWTYKIREFKPETHPSYEAIDVILTCVDSIKARIEIGEYYREQKTDAIWIDVGNDAHSGQVITGHLGIPKFQPRKANWFDLVGERMREVKETNTDSCSHEDSLRKQSFGINHLSAVNMTQALWQYVRHGKIENAFQAYDLKAGTAQSMPMTNDTYASFGLAV